MEHKFVVKFCPPSNQGTDDHSIQSDPVKMTLLKLQKNYEGIHMSLRAFMNL